MQAPTAPPLPYPVFRADVLAAVGNLCHGRRAAQDRFAELGAVEVVLASCAFDPAGPTVREWALWAVRNLCDGNEGVQRRIKELRPDESLQDDAMRGEGQRVVLDGDTGRFRLAPAESADGPAAQ